jgi:predicted thioesterase
VEFRRTIAHYDRRLPPVLSTPSMIGQMEVAAALLLQPHLPPGWISVGTHINVAHVAAATVGQTLRVTAAFERRRKRRLVFAVEAKVGRKTIGYGTVERAIVDGERFARPTLKPRRP